MNRNYEQIIKVKTLAQTLQKLAAMDLSTAVQAVGVELANEVLNLDSTFEEEITQIIPPVTDIIIDTNNVSTSDNITLNAQPAGAPNV